TDSRAEVKLADAKLIKSDAKIGDLVLIESTPQNAGRIAAQTAKQVILQRLHEAEHSAIIEEYAGKSGDIVSGVVQRVEPRQVTIELGRAQAVLPSMEQIPGERYRIGQRLKVFLVEVSKSAKGPRVIVSRSHPELLKRLFELEVPEVTNGQVEIKSVAREAGFRSKVAVAARQPGIDPVGCCVGLRGIRIQNIVTELSGEKIDVVQWNADPAAFIASALSPAQIIAVELKKGDGIATVIVPDRQLSLAIGKEGQNARLAAKLTGWKIDIKMGSVWETEREAAKPAVAEETKEEAAAPVAEVAAVAGATVEEAAIEEPEETPAAEQPETPAETEEETGKPVVFNTASPVKKELRFAEDILSPRADDSAKVKKKKKGTPGKEREGEGPRVRKGGRRQEFTIGDDEDIGQ
ncbi:MAG TPA: transcription termination factor NusA, partial [Dehalococcoidales bacterium]|nr:transcription termination factor NusA [Dehalococcoidales bacterium]